MRSAQDDGDDLAKDDAHRAFHAEIVALAGNRQLDLALEPILLKLQRPMAVNLRLEASIRDRGRGCAGTPVSSPRSRPTTGRSFSRRCGITAGSATWTCATAPAAAVLSSTSRPPARADFTLLTRPFRTAHCAVRALSRAAR